ncbi:MAG: recombinase family protein [Clostridiales bacterium]|jgi:DNA invertase Pin-like site-specific DNA recombinase|nr:recombinase family protein [Clostridiales bacterium]
MSNNNATREPAVFGYVRVSMKEQNPDRQLIALAPYKIPPGNIFIDQKSGKDFNRPKYKRLFRILRAGDLLYIKSIDRLGRDYNEIIEQWRLITREKGVDIKVLDMPMLDTTYCKDLLGTFISDLVLQVLSFSAQLERENILQRQAEGIAAAKARGVAFGRKAIVVPDNFQDIFLTWRSGKITGKEAASRCGFSVKTLYNLTTEWRKTSSFNPYKALDPPKSL